MIDSLILHQSTKEQLAGFIIRPSHALLLAGPAGIGKTAIAKAIATEVLGQALDSYPYYLMIQPIGQSISIDIVRELQKFLLLKTTGKGDIRRIVIIEHAHKMTTEAQNAFLKLLEEPPADTLIMLTAHSARDLLPTITSRTQSLSVLAPTESQLQPLIRDSAKDEKTRNQAWFLSGGLPGLLHALLYEEDHPLLASVALAKELLQKDIFERLALVDSLSKQKEQALGVVEALDRIAQAGLAGAGGKGDDKRLRQWHLIRSAALQAREALMRSANAKLVLTNMLLAIH